MQDLPQRLGGETQRPALPCGGQGPVDLAQRRLRVLAACRQIRQREGGLSA